MPMETPFIPKVCASILAGDFGSLSKEAKRIEDSGADGIHIDIMDGHFVPNLTMGPKAVTAIRKSTSLFLDVHLMIYNPFDYVERFIEAGADMITFHLEATEDIEDVANFIRKCNKKVGIAINPETSFSMIPKLLPLCDMILLMTVNPGFSGQKFLDSVVDKIALTRKYCEEAHVRQGGIIAKTDKEKTLPPFTIQVDGGIDEKTAPICVAAGANSLVAGSYLFQQEEMKRGVDILMRSLSEGKRY